METMERRKYLLDIIKSSKDPIKGSELSRQLKVSRQVIVQDIALLRAKNHDIIATSQGYMIYAKDCIKERIRCKNHTSNDEIYDELVSIVNMGGKVKDVIISHPIYGKIKAELNISSQKDILEFMENTKKNEFKQLSLLSQEEHLHTIEASNIEIIESIKKELRNKSILL